MFCLVIHVGLQARNDTRVIRQFLLQTLLEHFFDGKFITVYADKSFSFETKSPPAAVLLRKAAGVAKGSGVPHREKVGKLNREQLEEIVKSKDGDLTAADMNAAVRTIAGTARSMGIEVEGVKDA